MLIQINSLYSLEDVSPVYYLDTERLSVVNIKTGREKKISPNKRGYPVVYLELKNHKPSGRTSVNVTMHKIVALALIKNAPYTLIEHLDDNQMNYSPENLRFSDQRSNLETMRRNGISNHHDKIFIVEMVDGRQYIDTMKNLSKILGIPRATLYDRYYFSRSNDLPRSKYQIKEIRLAKESQSDRCND